MGFFTWLVGYIADDMVPPIGMMEGDEKGWRYAETRDDPKRKGKGNVGYIQHTDRSARNEHEHELRNWGGNHEHGRGVQGWGYEPPNRDHERGSEGWWP
jgi:hypothetical protein